MKTEKSLQNLSIKEKTALKNLIKTKNNKIIINDMDKNMGAADADKSDVTFECISLRQLSDVKTYYKLTETEIKNVFSEIKNKLRNLVSCHMYKGNCTKNRSGLFTVKNVYII